MVRIKMQKKKKKLQIWSFEISFYRVKTLYLKLYEKLLEIPQVKYHFSKIPPIKKIITFEFIF